MVPVLLIIGLVVLVWIVCFIAFNDLFLPSRSLKKYRNILCFFAHMDDETVLAGGLMAQAVRDGKNVTLMTLTKGDRGNDDRQPDPELPAIRKAELNAVLKIFGVTDLIHLPFPDDTLRVEKVKKYVERTVDHVKPDLVITFDLNGWYGHPDHIACAEAVTEVVKGRRDPTEEYSEIDLWYAVRPEAVNRAARLVAKLRRGGAILSPRTPPGCKVFIGGSVFKKIKAIYQYKSQMSALRPGVTVGPIPMWFFMSAQPYEYIVEA